MMRWLGGLSVLTCLALTTLVSGDAVRLLGSAYYAPGYLFPIVGYGCGLALVYPAYRGATHPRPASAPRPPGSIGMTARDWETLATVVGLGLTGAACAIAAGQSATLSWGGIAVGEFPAFALPPIGFLLGYGPLYLMVYQPIAVPPDRGWTATWRSGLVLAILLLWSTALIAVFVGDFAIGQALTVCLSGSVVIACSGQVVSRLQAGEGFAVESHWGGLGGGLGGVRVSSLTTSVLLALIFGAVMITAAAVWPRPPAPQSAVTRSSSPPTPPAVSRAPPAGSAAPARAGLGAPAKGA